jgi:serine/threonine protein kinase
VSIPVSDESDALSSWRYPSKFISPNEDRPTFNYAAYIKTPDETKARQPPFQPQFIQLDPSIYAKTSQFPAYIPTAKDQSQLRTDKSRFEIIRSIDPRGSDAPMSFGIYLIKNKANGKLFVEKRVMVGRVKGDENWKRVYAEIDALKQVKEAGGSRYINTVHEVFFSGTRPYCSMVLEFCDAGTIDQVIDSLRMANGTPPLEAYAWHILTGITKALCFIHDGIDIDSTVTSSLEPRKGWKTICHLDIKPGNIFLTHTNTTGGFPRVVLGDFGCCYIAPFSTFPSSTNQTKQVFGTPGWYPPENDVKTITGRGDFGTQTDIWQTGAVISSLCRLFNEPDQRLADEKRPCGSRFSKELNCIVACMMLRERTDRPAAVQVAEVLRKAVGKYGVPY